jgi:hypothetical protein
MKVWKHFVVIVSLILGLSAWGHAESSPSQQAAQEHHGQGYGFFAPGAIVDEGYSLSTAHFGAGGEHLLYKGLGVGGEIGYLAPWRDFSLGIGILSVDGSYHFTRTNKVSPFVTGGYSMAFREGHINLINFGGGVNYWFHDRMGIRLEFRDHISSQYNIHYLSGRIGFSFR